MKRIITGLLCSVLLVVLLGCPQPVKTDVTYKVAFDSQGGSPTDTVSVKSGEKALRPVDPVKEGYSFAGWYKETDGVNIWNFDTDTVSADITLYAKWSLDSYTVTFNTNGGSEVAALTADHGAKITAPAAPVKTGYGFDGWYKEEALTSAWDFEKDTVTAAVTLYAKWKAGSFTISYELSGGINAEENPANYTIETADITLASPSRTGYTFGGWFEKEDLSGDAVSKIAKGSSGDKKVYAKWSVVVYTISYNVNGGTNAAANPADYTIESSTITLASPSYSGYVFDGWFSSGDFSGDDVTSISRGNTGNKVLYAKWLEIYDITYNLNSGTNDSANPASYTIKSETITFADPARTGYTFGGWFTASNFSGTAVTTISMGSTGDKVLYAKWSQNIQFVSVVQTGGADKTAVSTGLTLTFDADPSTLSLSNITVTGAEKVSLSGSGTSRTLVISNVSVGNGDTVSVAVASPEGFSISGSPKTAVVYSDTYVGKAYQGGKIAYIFKPGDSGYTEGTIHGLIASASDIKNGSGYRVQFTWITGGSSATTLNGGTATVLGTGQANTTAMISQAGFDGGAAKACDDYVNTESGTGVYSDWYLPSIDEFAAMYENQTAIGGFDTISSYWTSSEKDASNAWFYGCASNKVMSISKNWTSGYVRPVRSF